MDMEAELLEAGVKGTLYMPHSVSYACMQHLMWA